MGEERPAWDELAELCRRLRQDVVKMISEAGSGHPGGSLSAVEVVATLYQAVLRHRPQEPEWPDRDRFILSKGHGVPAQYAALAACGYFPKEQLMTLRKLGSQLQGHPVRGTVPGVEACTGSLGQGLSIAVGVALALQLDQRDARVFCMMGDGELQEGQVWEAAMSASKFKLTHLTAIVDHNKGQIDGPVQEVMPIEPLEDKFRAFGWQTQRINGHNLPAVHDALTVSHPEKPTLIVADTVKGKGISFMEQELMQWHGVAPSAEQLKQAMLELEARTARSA